LLVAAVAAAVGETILELPEVRGALAVVGLVELLRQVRQVQPILAAAAVVAGILG
jgi:hypothetical protein